MIINSWQQIYKTALLSTIKSFEKKLLQYALSLFNASPFFLLSR